MPVHLDDLVHLSSKSVYYSSQHVTHIKGIRAKAIKEAATALGIQSGLASEANSINKMLGAHADDMDKVFDFKRIIYKQHILLPVIEKAINAVRIGDGGNAIRIGGVVYRIVRQVTFVTVPPTWRDYLWLQYKKPEFPNKILLPKNDKERSVWQRNIYYGWNLGVKQAIEIYKINLHKLRRDFNGMLIYKLLLMQHMVSPFYIKEKKLGITGDKSNMTVDDRSIRILNKPELQLHSKIWQMVSKTPKTPVAKPVANIVITPTQGKMPSKV